MVLDHWLRFSRLLLLDERVVDGAPSAAPAVIMNECVTQAMRKARLTSTGEMSTIIACLID